MIWRYAIEGFAPRAVFTSTFTAEPGIFGPRLCHDMLRCDPPLLYVPEARKVFLKSTSYQVYPAHQITSLRDPNASYQFAPVYFNPYVDTLLAYSLGSSGTWNVRSPLAFPAEIRRTVRTLAVSHDTQWVFQHPFHYPVRHTTVRHILTKGVKFFNDLPALETLIVLMIVGTRLPGQFPSLVPIDLEEARKADPDFVRMWMSVFGFLGMRIGVKKMARNLPKMEFVKLEWK